MFDPEEASYSAVSDSLTIEEAEITAGFHSSPSKDTAVMVNAAFTAVAEIRDLSSGMKIEDIAWKVGRAYMPSSDHCSE